MSNHLEEKTTPIKERYDSLDGLRAYSAIGIIVMHVLANGRYGLNGFLFERFIPSWTDLVFLFMVISGFSMCCGYYEKVISGKIDFGKFYSKRFGKVWPFFAVLCLLEFAMAPGWGALCETLANLTLCFGLFPSVSLSVIGVGWFLGLVFVFYFLFPFFCSLLSDKKKAWMAFAVALLLNVLCIVYFKVGRKSIAHSGVYFMAGGMLYLYRNTLRGFANRFGWVVIAGAAAFAIAYYLLGEFRLLLLPLFCLLTIWAMRDSRRTTTILCNPMTKMLSGISLEIYLCHMMVFRLLEKLKLTQLFPSPLLSFAVTVVATVAGAIIVSLVINKLLSMLKDICNKRKVRCV